MKNFLSKIGGWIVASLRWLYSPPMWFRVVMCLLVLSLVVTSIGTLFRVFDPFTALFFSIGGIVLALGSLACPEDNDPEDDKDTDTDDIHP